MVVRAPLVIGLLLLVLALLAGVALLVPRGGERMVARAGSRLSGQVLRDCLGSRLGLAWQGDPHVMVASTFGLRVVVTDSGPARQIGLFTTGGRPLSSGESGALEACLATK